ncbi:hypothetical protein OIDMADRAFT_174081 [Oidiodendron maius Zn]|uniref:Uncharacterized protein n=1 Tax=Oidiodendron maius (strain Zn) TaxID=913774 RepID=A0A0C3DY14_OIDMZ|nr:hypothetical protein OIDMADRAFT_174081 [Oidiodendron maius Zn]
MPKNPYKVYEGASEGLSMASSAAGAATGFSNPMGGVLNAQKAYHMHQYGKLQKKGMEQALANEERAIQRRREMETPQAKASDMTYGANGITKENGYIRDSDGKITYVGVKK